MKRLKEEAEKMEDGDTKVAAAPAAAKRTESDVNGVVVPINERPVATTNEDIGPVTVPLSARKLEK